ncbi:MAG: hypothetical protein GF349_03980 [Candidatus Magasanikbacteria bacterium]|nr:hypothetical protein [Candidatus Magasanikbacteria bacterium]
MSAKRQLSLVQESPKRSYRYRWVDKRRTRVEITYEDGRSFTVSAERAVSEFGIEIEGVDAITPFHGCAVDYHDGMAERKSGRPKT